MSDIAKTIGQRIRNYRTQKGLSQDKLAELAGVHPTYIGQLERGEKNATLESISKITAGLSINMSTLFEKIEFAESREQHENYPLIAYDLVQSIPKGSLEKLISIMRNIIDMT